MAYIGNPPADRYSKLAKQDLTGDGTIGPYTLDYAVGSVAEIEVFVNHVRQEPTTAYTVAGDQLTMTGTVASTDDFYVVFQGKAIASGQVPEKQSDGSYVYLGDVDINGNELILDADADTSITADTDDQIDIKIGGSDVASFTSNGLKMVDGKGIDFSATSDGSGTTSSELFDDYEEGTFTPTLFGASGTTSITYVRQLGVYRKIGNVVFYIIRFQWSAFSGGTGGIKIGNLPFTSRAQSDSTFDVNTGVVSHGVTIPSDGVDIPGFYTAASNTELVSIYTRSDLGWGTWAATGFYTTSANHYMSLSGSYFTD